MCYRLPVCTDRCASFLSQLPQGKFPASARVIVKSVNTSITPVSLTMTQPRQSVLSMAHSITVGPQPENAHLT